MVIKWPYFSLTNAPLEEAVLVLVLIPARVYKMHLVPCARKPNVEKSPVFPQLPLTLRPIFGHLPLLQGHHHRDIEFKTLGLRNPTRGVHENGLTPESTTPPHHTLTGMIVSRSSRLVLFLLHPVVFVQLCHVMSSGYSNSSRRVRLSKFDYL